MQLSANVELITSLHMEAVSPPDELVAVGGGAVSGGGQRLLVPPVRRDAKFRDVVHLGGADLHLDGQPVGARRHRVQALVPVRLGRADVVLV